VPFGDTHITRRRRPPDPNGTIVDGTGDASFVGDVAIDGDRVAIVGDVTAAGRREIDANGKIVAPGFVDMHTHYDDQATWDDEMAPSSWHGVTTVVMGNCGVGFAPAKPDRHQWLIGLMEGVEDIPRTALAEGTPWNWETFPEYLDALDEMPRTVDMASHVAHGAVRAYVLGDREKPRAVPTPEDVEQMSAIVEDALRAGALGFSTSRTVLHRDIDGELVPGTMPLAFLADHADAAPAWSRCIDINLKGTLNGMSEAFRVETQGSIKVTIVKPTGVPATGLGAGVINPPPSSESWVRTWPSTVRCLLHSVKVASRTSTSTPIRPVMPCSTRSTSSMRSSAPSINRGASRSATSRFEPPATATSSDPGLRPGRAPTTSVRSRPPEPAGHGRVPVARLDRDRLGPERSTARS